MDDEPVSRSPLYPLTPADRDHLLAIGEQRMFDEDDVLIHQGDPTDHVFVVLAGRVRAYSTNRDGHEVVLAVRGPGDVLGEVAALHGWPRTISLRAMDRVHVLQLRRQQFLDVLRERPEIAIALVKLVSIRLHEADAALLEFATQDVSRRVAGYLLRIAGQHGVADADGIQLGVALSQQEIANRVGASPRGVSRAMAMLRDRGMVVTAPRRIVILRPEMLRSFAGN